MSNEPVDPATVLHRCLVTTWVATLSYIVTTKLTGWGGQSALSQPLQPCGDFDFYLTLQCKF
jgi:hypothetical protein